MLCKCCALGEPERTTNAVVFHRRPVWNKILAMPGLVKGTMQLVSRLILGLMLILQPTMCWESTSCAQSHETEISPDCCCGDACPSAAPQDDGVIASCDCCSSDQPLQPVSPSKSSKDWRADSGILQSVLVLPTATSTALALRPQVAGNPPSRSLNAFICVWLT